MPPDPQAVLLDDFLSVRRNTARLCEPLSPEDCLAQSMDDASPAKWHLAHTSWFFETFVLERAYGSYRHFDPAFRVLFNSYYQGVGPQHPRPRRGLLTRPSLDTVYSYRDHVDGHVTKILAGDGAVDAAVLPLIRLGIEHEQQHQELILTDLKHLLACNPLHPAYRTLARPATRSAAPLGWGGYAGGVIEVGHAGRGFAFDNECPRHRCVVEPFELASRAVTNAEFLAFIDDGGYRRSELWLSEGWDTILREGWAHPLYWQSQDGAWQGFTLGGMRPLVPTEPVCHVSLFEADAYARWAGARLPSEQEWEHAAAPLPVSGNFLEQDLLQPAPAPEGGLPAQLFGDVWEWTRSPYVAYPRFRAAAGAIGEYNAKFMSSQIVLRGGSCATPRSHLRATYRNFFPPTTRWQFSGIRLARDAG